MKLHEVLPAFYDGKKICRKNWATHTTLWNNLSYTPHLKNGDFLADDWEIVQDYKPECLADYRLEYKHDEIGEGHYYKPEAMEYLDRRCNFLQKQIESLAEKE